MKKTTSVMILLAKEKMVVPALKNHKTSIMMKMRVITSTKKSRRPNGLKSLLERKE